MPDSSYVRASPEEIPNMLRSKFYLDVDGKFRFLDTGKEVRTYVGNSEGHHYMRVYFAGKSKALAVHRAIWMFTTGEPIPADFEIHHRDEDNQNNAWENLLCLHKLDHRKFHYANEVPF